MSKEKKYLLNIHIHTINEKLSYIFKKDHDTLINKNGDVSTILLLIDIIFRLMI